MKENVEGKGKSAMLYRVMAPSGCGKRERILQEAVRAYGEGKPVFVLVPEQNTAETELELLRRLGPRMNGLVEVTNFSRLPNLVLRRYGQLAGETPTEEERLFLLWAVLEEHRPALERISVRSRAQELCAFRAELEELRLSGLGVSDLGELGNEDALSLPTREKLRELALILSAYETASEALFCGAEDECDRLARVLETAPFFRGAVVLVDGFWDFTVPQERILRRILGQADEVWVSLTTLRRESELFSKGYQAALRLFRMAGEARVEVRDEILPIPEEEGDLAFLRRHVLTPAVPRTHEPQGLSVAFCRDLPQEAEYVAQAVRRLASEGVRWNEIAILSRAGEAEELLGLSLEQQEIPFFLEEKRPLAEDPLAQTLLLAATLALGEGGEEELRRYVLSGQFTASEEDRFVLEKYLATWGIRGRAALSPKPFEEHPDGYERPTEESEEERRRVNLAKERILSPLRQLSFGLAQGSVAERISALTDFLHRIGAEQALEEATALARSQERFEEAAHLVRTWNTVLERLSAVVRTLGDRECDAERFLTLLELAFSGTLPGSVPPGQDRVFVGRVNFSRPQGVRYVFLMGMNSGVFPAEEKKGGLFTPEEREEITGYGYSLLTGDRAQKEEAFYFYQAASFAREGLFLSCCSATGDEKGEVSLFLKRVLALFPRVRRIRGEELRRHPVTADGVFRAWLSANGAWPEGERFRTYFLQEEKTRDRALFGMAARAFPHGKHLVRPHSLFSGDTVKTSYSRLEQYTRCPYSYFAKYHLKAKKSGKARFASNVVGTFVHDVLERVLSSLFTRGRRLADVPLEELEEINRLTCEDYLSDVFPRLSGARVEALVRQVVRSTLLILKNLRQEFSVSGFQPLFFEKDLESLGDGYRLKTPGGKTLLLRGSIDRVDTYRDENGVEYVRVVDYKTGGHDFKWKNVVNGLDLQMLLYLFALWEKGYELDGVARSPLPAGILYLNGTDESVSCSGPAELQKQRENPFLALNRKGVLLEDPRLLRVQDPEGMGQYIPVAWNNPRSRNGEKLLSLERLGILKERTEKHLARLVDEMERGQVEALPLCKGKTDSPCRYCEFKPVCKRDPEKNRAFCEDPYEKVLFGKEN